MLDNTKKNDTVNKLLNYFSEYIKIYENKLKANNLFNEVDERVHRNLSELVYNNFKIRKLSNQRYKCVKSGNSIESVLTNQREQYIDLIKNLINEKDLFCNNEIVTEKKKFFKLKDPKNKDVGVLRSTIKDGKNSVNELLPSLKKTSNFIKLTDMKKTTSSKIDQNTTREDRMELSKNQCIYEFIRFEYARE